MNPGRPGGNRRQDDFRRRHREIGTMVLPDADEGEADLIGQLALKDEVAQRLRLRERLTVGAYGDVAKGIEPQFDRLCHVQLAIIPRRVDTGDRGPAGALGWPGTRRALDSDAPLRRRWRAQP